LYFVWPNDSGPALVRIERAIDRDPKCGKETTLTGGEFWWEKKRKNGSGFTGGINFASEPQVSGKTRVLRSVRGINIGKIRGAERVCD